MYKVSEGALDWALAHLKKFGDTDIFPMPFEFDAIERSWDEVKTFLLKEDLDTWAIRSHRSCLTPICRFSYRIATQLDPLDSILFAAITSEIG